MKKTGPCYKCRGPHFQCECTNNGNNKFQNNTTTQQAQKNNFGNEFHNNKTSNNMFSMETLSFQTSKPIKSSKDMLVSIDTTKCFWEKYERYSFKEKMKSQHEDTVSSDSSVN